MSHSAWPRVVLIKLRLQAAHSAQLGNLITWHIPNKEHTNMLTLLRDGGIPMWFILAFGLVSLVIAIRYAMRPEIVAASVARDIPLIRPRSLGGALRKVERRK